MTERKFGRRLRCFLMMCILAACIWPAAESRADAEGKSVRVGVFELNGFYEKDSQGNPKGYGVDYLESVAERTGWSYEYVWLKNWDECVENLRQGKVDLIAPAQKTAERMQEFGFSSFSIGMECGTLLSLSTNDDLIYEDFRNFGKITIGCVDTFVFKQSFLNYAMENGFTPHLVTYRDTKALMAALQSGEVDAALVNLFVKTDTTKILAKFDVQPFYFMLQKDENMMIRELNDALQQIKMGFAEFEANLTKRYYPEFNETPFTKSELDYIASMPVMTVGCRSQIAPVSYWDEGAGEIRGITREILDEISRISGLKFEYVPLPEENVTYDYLRDNHIALISSVEYNKENTTASGIKLTIPYLDSKKVFVCLSDTQFDTNKPMKLAVATGSQTLQKEIHNVFPNFEIYNYDSVEACFDAVRNKEADALLQNQYVVSPWLVKPVYSGMITIPAESLEDRLCISPVIYQEKGVEESYLADERLIDILNKSIRRIPEEEISKIIISQTSENLYTYTFQDFLYQYRFPLMALAVIVTILLALLCYVIEMRKESVSLIRKNEEKLRHITNNINGGVVVLTANDELRITYANEGFLELLQYGREEYETVKNQKCITYVHPEDTAVLKSIMCKDISEDNRISIKLRIMRKDGNFVPTLFNGTVTENTKGAREIFCVIMDNSEQEHLMEQISMEQRKYGILIENSGDIIFEVDCIGKTLNVSSVFEQKFGWRIHSDGFSGRPSDVLPLFRVHEEDLERLKNISNEAYDKNKNLESVVRIMKADGSYLWCRIAQYPMMDAQNKPVYVIGKILDIDEEVREKMELEQKSRTDALTGLLNKEAFFVEAREYLTCNEAKNTAIVFIDMDNFKQVNDNLGHMAGDKAIKDCAKKLQVIFSHYDILSRFGGDEFCLLLKEIPEETLKDKLAWTVEKLNTDYSADGITVHCSVSIGAACTRGRNRNLKEWMDCADKALYKAKENGKNQYVIHYDGL